MTEQRIRFKEVELKPLISNSNTSSSSQKVDSHVPEPLDGSSALFAIGQTDKDVQSPKRGRGGRRGKSKGKGKGKAIDPPVDDTMDVDTGTGT